LEDINDNFLEADFYARNNFRFARHSPTARIELDKEKDEPYGHKERTLLYPGLTGTPMPFSAIV